MSEHPTDDLPDRIQELLDGTLEAEEIRRLDVDLKASREARDLFRQLATLHSALEEQGAAKPQMGQALIPMEQLLADQRRALVRNSLVAAAAVLLAVCLAYAFASVILPQPYDLWLLYGAYIFDSVLFALRIARTTYLKKIAEDPADITPTMSVGLTIDHAVAMSLPIFSGWIWVNVGYQWVFVMAAGIALAGFFVCLRIRVPRSA